MSLRAAALALLGGFGAGLLALAVFHTTTMGNCASGPVPYLVLRPCPSNTGYWFGALGGSIVLVLVVGALAGGGLATTGVIFVAVGGACIASIVTGSASRSWLISGIVIGLLFVPLGLQMVRMQPPRLAMTALAALVPLALIGAAGAAVTAIAIPGPIKDPKRASSNALPTVTALGSESWFRAANLRRGLGVVQSRLGRSARVSSTDLRPAVAVVSARSGSTAHDFNLTVGAEPEDFTSARGADERSIAIAAIDVHAPQRLLAEIRRRFHVPADRIEHIDFSLGVIDHKPQWEAYLKDSSDYFHAGPRGTPAQRCHDGICK